MDDDIFGPRIARYVSGRCAPGEAAEVRRWIAEDPARARLVQEFAEVWETATRMGSHWDVDSAWHDLVAARYDRVPAAAAPDTAQRPAVAFEGASIRPLWRRWSARAAAAALVLAGPSALGWHLTRRTEEPALAAPIEFATRPGQRALLRFSDGTRVELGVASTLRYSPAQGASARDVHLEGEAYFDVVHDPRRPFTVHTARAVARDLGTRFGVRAYADDGDVEVVVAEGVVDLRPATPADTGVADSLILTVADLGRLDRAGRLSVQHGVDTDARLAWRDGRLIFRDTPLREALPQLRRWYDVELQLGDPSLGDYPLTASLRDEPFERVLELITAALNLRTERRGDAIVLFAARAA